MDIDRVRWRVHAVKSAVRERKRKVGVVSEKKRNDSREQNEM